MMIRLSAALMALSMLLATHVSAATLSALPSTVLFKGSAEYLIDVDAGLAFADGTTDDGDFELSASVFFDAGTPGDNPTLEDLTLTDIATSGFVNARGLEGVEIGADTVWVLFGDLDGALAGQFSGGKLLAFFSASKDDTVTTFELRRLDNVEVIPLPATGLLLVAGIAALGLARRRRR